MKKNIAFGGVTRVPGGAVSSDGDLCAAVDVCNDGMGLEMIEKPELLFTLRNSEDETAQLKFTEELLCIHEPEGEDKHYITQLFVESTATVQRSPTPQNIEVSPIAPIINDDAYAPTGDVVPYDPPETAELTVDDIFSAWGESNMIEDNGGTIMTWAPGSTSATLSAGIYLCYWEKAEGETEYTCKEEINITPFGKVTAIQPMGNTLICNHEGGANFPKEIRYWLWKAADNTYLGLGSKPPMINITFGLESTFEYYPKKKSSIRQNGVTQIYSYRNYGGVFIDSLIYTDTVSVWWDEEEYGPSTRVPPMIYYAGENGTPNAHWASSYSLDGVPNVEGFKLDWTTYTLGAYNKFIAEQNKDNKFVFPFYARYAYEMYDGSLIMHSNPVLLIPNSRGPIFALDGNYGLTAGLKHKDQSYEKVHLNFRGRTYGFSSKLMYDLKTLSQDDLARLENWKDLIRGINIYITPPIYNYKQGGQVLGWRCMSPLDPINNITEEEVEDGVTAWDKYYTIGKVKYTDKSGAEAVEKTLTGNVRLSDAFMTILPKLYHGPVDSFSIFWPYDTTTSPPNNPTFYVPDYVLEIPQKDEAEVTELHENAGQFFKYYEIPYEKLINIAGTAQGEQEVAAKKKVLTTIANQDIMKDDNGSHDTMSASVLYGYNRRLNMANVSKILHSPLPPSVQWARDYGKKTQGGQIQERNYPYQVTVYAKNGAEIARLKSAETGVNTVCPQYVFYPNVEAFEVLITRGEGSDLKNYRVRLKEHKALNGAFWLADFMATGYDLVKNYKLEDDATSSDINLPEANKVVDERSKIYTSATDNPFVIPFGNINIAGGGDVRALCAATQAMSQGQFGQHPMYTFTSEGVWAMSVNDTGGWSTIQPVTRDVIVDGTKPLSLDSTVLFLSERGLLQLAGSDIKVLSDILQGADPLILNTPNFGLHRLDDLCASTATDTEGLLNIATALALNKFPENAWMTYDYDNARIYVTPQNGNGSWVYNLKSGIWTQATTKLDNQVVSYPECEAQCEGKVMRISVDRAITDNLRSKGLVISRPIKLDDMGLLKRWREIAVRGRFKPYSTAVQVALWGTRDWIDSALVASSTRNRLTRWSGSPYFGHSVGLFLTRPSYAMQIAGMDIEVDSEHDNKLR